MTCKHCGADMEKQSNGNYWCRECGAEMLLETDGSYFETEPYDYDDVYGVPEGCRACGNPMYPDCKDSCKLFDD